MKYKLLTSLTIYSLTMAGICHAAEDDVYVDLSVLDNMPKDSIGFITPQPLFPEIKAKSVTKTKPVQSKAKKKVITIVQPQPVKPEVPQEKLLPEKENKVVVERENKPIETEESSWTEPEKPILEITAPVEAEKVSEPENILPEVVQNSEKTPEETKEIPAQNSIQPENTETVLSAKISEDTAKKQKISDFEPREIYSISFTLDTADLSNEALQRLEKMTEIFSPDRKKKIAIRAYNYENGQDSFRKKRISLNRATNVRSFFLSKGFKNFSIKIINTTTDNEYKDTVEIEEIN